MMTIEDIMIIKILMLPMAQILILTMKILTN